LERHHISDFTNGWIVGNFSPSVHKNSEFEVAVKILPEGSLEPRHAQRVGTEITIVVSGNVRMNSDYFSEGDVIVIPPLEASDFEALSDCSLVCIKFPSAPEDKYLDPRL
jgi:hypothetical protein